MTTTAALTGPYEWADRWASIREQVGRGPAWQPLVLWDLYDMVRDYPQEQLVRCPVCIATVGEPCHAGFVSTRPAKKPHEHRVTAARLFLASEGREDMADPPREPLTVTRYTGHGLRHTYRDDVPLGA